MWRLQIIKWRNGNPEYISSDKIGGHEKMLDWAFYALDRWEESWEGKDGSGYIVRELHEVN